MRTLLLCMYVYVLCVFVSMIMFVCYFSRCRKVNKVVYITTVKPVTVITFQFIAYCVPVCMPVFVRLF